VENKRDFGERNRSCSQEGKRGGIGVKALRSRDKEGMLIRIKGARLMRQKDSEAKKRNSESGIGTGSGKSETRYKT